MRGMDLHEKQSMYAWWHSGSSRGKTLTKPDSPKIDRGCEIRLSMIRDVSGLKGPT